MVNSASEPCFAVATVYDEVGRLAARLLQQLMPDLAEYYRRISRSESLVKNASYRKFDNLFLRESGACLLWLMDDIPLCPRPSI